MLDRTGNRRFWVATLLNIDWGYAETMDVDQLWARARYAQDEAEKNERDYVNDEYMIDDPVDMILNEVVQITGDPNDVVKANRLQTIVESRAISMAVARSMKKRGAVKARVRVKGVRVRAYRGVILTLDQ